MQKDHVRLSAPDREHLQQLVLQHKVSIKSFRRAQALLLLDQGHTLQHAAATVGVSYGSVAQWRDRYLNEGLAVLQDRARSGRPLQIDGRQRAQITALACSSAPAGQARWSLRLLASKAVELGYVEGISHKHVATILKKTTSSRTSSRPGASES